LSLQLRELEGMGWQLAAFPAAMKELRGRLHEAFALSMLAKATGRVEMVQVMDARLCGELVRLETAAEAMLEAARSCEEELEAIPEEMCPSEYTVFRVVVWGRPVFFLSGVPVQFPGVLLVDQTICVTRQIESGRSWLAPSVVARWLPTLRW